MRKLFLRGSVFWLRSALAVGLCGTYACIDDTASSERPIVQSDATDDASPEDTSDATLGDVRDSGAEVGPLPEDALGLEATATVYRDATGALHIYATNLSDALFLQGYETARDRIFQMDQLRIFVEGRRAEAFGAGFLSNDIAMRTLDVSRLAHEGAAFYEREHPEVFALAQRYADGVNAYIDRMTAGHEDAYRPAEFDRIDPTYTPRPWAVADVVLITKAMILSQNFQADIELAIFAGRTLMGRERFGDLYPTAPMFGTYVLEESPTPYEAISYGQRVFGDAKELDLALPHLPTAEELVEARAAAWIAGALADALGRDHVGISGGSNSWVVAGDHTVSGGSILCNETHMPMRQPSQLYPTRLMIDGPDETIDAFGYAAPGVPMLLIGNTRDVAWGLTNPFTDVNDLFRETITADGTATRHLGEDVPMEIRDEVFRVRQPDGTFEETTRRLRRVPHHGPMMNDLLPDEVANVLNTLRIAFSVRWSGFEPHTTELVTGLGMLRARAIDDQWDALRAFNGGTIAWVLADAGGRIGFVAAGGYPIRARPFDVQRPDDPMDGTGPDTWQGYFAFDEIPRMDTPEKGYIVASNNAIGANGLDDDSTTGGFYFSHFSDLGTRAWRITELLEERLSEGVVTLDQSRAIQLDHQSIYWDVYEPPFRLAIERACLADDASLPCLAGEMALAWDGAQTVESAAASVFNVWLLYFWYEIVIDDIPDQVFALLGQTLDNTAARAIGHWLRGQLPAGGRDYYNDTRTGNQETVEDIAVRALELGVAQLAEHFGAESDPLTWAWGEIHRSNHPHEIWSDYDAPTYPQDSGFRTVNAADYRLLDDGAPAAFPYLQNEGSQIRYCVELGGDDQVVWGGLNGSVVGHAEEAAYLDQIEDWVSNRTYIIPMDLESVASEATHVRPLAAGWPYGGTQP